MSVRLTVLSVILVCTAGCAAESQQADPTPTTMGLGEVRTRDPLLGSQCRVPCTISPGAGCC